ncbi:Rieske (2Fe-2S) protein [Rothia halotolerans]|uniref:Rieske (2Fe-2S) protein n=1 Tax=Rothia halotolerans TaxID=405770 RepID=UPI00101D58BB|nr:Rieske (2Fe-2S) protein [Rothia halotolerans]
MTDVEHDLSETAPRGARQSPAGAAEDCGGCPPSRRRAIAGAGLLAGSAGLLAACGGSEEDGDGDGAPEGGEPVDLAAAADVPLGGALKATEQGFTAMLTQPAEGEFRAFSSACTHQGCTLNVQGSEIVCPCHSSKFSPEDGSVQGGPAPEPLPEYAVSVSGGRLVIGG